MTRVDLFATAPDTDEASSTAVLDVFAPKQGLNAFDWLTAGIILVASIIVAQIAKRLLQSFFARKLDPALATLISRVVSYVLVLIGLIYALDSLGVEIAPIIGALGIAGIALAFALQDILENFVAGVLLQLKRPFTYGDQVMINGHEGTVESIDSRLVTIVEPNGETVLIPSASVIKADIINYTQIGRRRTSLPVGVAYGTDLSVAQRVLTEAVTGSAGVLASPSPEVLFEAFGESSIDFVVRFWHEPKIADFWSARSEVGVAIDAALADASITIPFPQRTVWSAGNTDA